MKPFIFIFSFCISLSFVSFSQGFYGEIEGGYNYPLGLFKSATGFTGGRVFPGFHAGGSVGYIINPTWSCGIRTIITRNETNGPPTIFITEFPLWKSRSILFSAKLSRPIFENFYAELEGQAGHIWASLPFTYRFGQNPIEPDQLKTSGWLVGARVGFKYYLNEKFALKISTNYLEGNLDKSNELPVSIAKVSLTLLNVGLLIEL